MDTPKPKRILMTGCSTGFGAAVHRNLLSRGHSICGIGLGGPNYEVDFRFLDQVNEFIQIWEDKHWEFDVLINNAGRMEFNPISLTTIDQIARAMAVNFYAPFLLTRTALDGLRRFTPEDPLRIINTTSMVVKTPSRECPGYVASKAALDAFTRAAARELAGRPVLFSNVAPCMVGDTAMQREGLENLQRRGMSPEAAAAYQRANPMGRTATHEEIAAVFRFAVEEMPPIMSGTTLWIPAGVGV